MRRHLRPSVSRIHRYTFRTTVPDERILTRFHHEGDHAQAKVVDASCFLGSYPG
ncbi:hypothetical protein [Actinoplanes utahensis]|uniref:hypothetical protein n=1 Tax=Actinoplanes utahensis TaxID=1869 RepID=UPI000A54A764|nr:hypothetical protein [Actinoplanes utahensis]GIF29560.1 hypothetical protein Aut01nite_25460 [Actinoplanes utahensis]